LTLFIATEGKSPRWSLPNESSSGPFGPVNHVDGLTGDGEIGIELGRRWGCRRVRDRTAKCGFYFTAEVPPSLLDVGTATCQKCQDLIADEIPNRSYYFECFCSIGSRQISSTPKQVGVPRCVAEDSLSLSGLNLIKDISNTKTKAGKHI
jgi:hypothetical protein